MKQANVEVDVNRVPLTSIDGVRDFTSMTGRFYAEYGYDATPLLEWNDRMRTWTSGIRRDFGEKLKHAAVVSEYGYGQFRNPEWKRSETHPLLALCTNDASREVTIDGPQLVSVIKKNGNDATASQNFLDFVNSVQTIVFAGVTTTSCVTSTLTSLLDHMQRKEIGLSHIVVARNGFAGRRSRAGDARRILDQLAEQERVIMVPTLKDIRWVDRSRP